MIGRDDEGEKESLRGFERWRREGAVWDENQRGGSESMMKETGKGRGGRATTKL